MAIRIESEAELIEYLDSFEWETIIPQAILDMINNQTEVVIENLADDEVRRIVEGRFDNFRQWTSAINVPAQDLRSVTSR